MSENRKMSSPYAVLDNRPIDQWKVTELKEELKKRKLMTKGLKEDLVKRLDEAVRTENAQAMRNTDKGFDSVPQPEVQSKNSVTFPSLVETIDSMDNGGKKIERLASDNDGDRNERVILDGLENIDSVNEKADTDVAKDVVDDGFGSLAKESVPIGDLMGSTVLTGAEVLQVAQQISEETTIIASESMGSEILLSGQEVQNSEIQDKCGVSDLLQDSEDSKPAHEEAKLNSSDVNCQVVEVSQVIYDSISIDTISITEKNELKDNVIADDVKLEVDFKPEMVQLSSSNIALYDDDLQSVDINESHADTVIVEEKDANQDENTDIGIKNDSGDVGSPEKLNLDRSSGDDSMEEDAPECKQIDSKFSHEISDKSEKVEVPVVKDDAPLDAMVEDMPVVKVVNVESQNGLAAASVKRKLHEEEAAGNTEITKKQRRWNAENLTVPEPLSGNVSASNTPKDAFQRTMKRSFSRSNSAVSDDTPKERVVPPSPKTPTNSLKIDRFLRPFTLKAVQELLGKTGSITSFWMDHIKTHCYVTYSSVEEATETRNAVYNLQWPTNGGRLLVAEFVDPQEVKIRLEAPPSPVIPVSNTPALPPSPAAPVQPPQPSPRLQVQRQHLPPPPPLSNPPPAREQLLPPPPPLPERVDLPILTLDDLFRKTKATPRIYYLPLSDEQVAAKLKAQGKTTTQSAGVACRNCSGKGGAGGAGSWMDLGFPGGCLGLGVVCILVLNPVS